MRPNTAGKVICLFTLALIVAGCTRSPAARSAGYLESGKKFLSHKDYTRAVLEFKNAIAATPKNGEAHYQLALAYLDSGDPVSAIESFRKAAELKHAGAQLKLAEMMTASSDTAVLEEAQRRAQSVLAGAPNNVDALNALAVAEWKLGKGATAEQRLEQALGKFPTSLSASVTLAQMKLARKDYAGAEKVLLDAARQAPGAAGPQVALGQFSLLAGNPADAEKHFQQALRIDGKEALALLGLASIQFRAGRNDEADKTFARISALSNKAYRPLHALFLLQTGKREAAIAELEMLAKADPSDSTIRTTLVEAYFASGRASDAERVLRPVLEKNPHDIEALLQHAKLSIGGGKYEQAQEDLRGVLQFQPNSAEAHYLLSRAYKARGLSMNQRQELSETLRLKAAYLPARLELTQLLIQSSAAKSALEIIDETPAEQKNTLPVIMQRNWVLLALGNWPELRKGIAQGLTLQRVPELVLQQGLLSFKDQNYQAAQMAFEEVLKASPADVRALQALAESYRVRKETALAIQKVRQYAAAQPGSAPMQQLLGSFLLNSGDRVAARTAFQTARNADPNFLPATLALVQMDMSESQWSDARRLLEGAYARDRNNPSIQMWLASLEEKTGNYAAAVDYYRKVLGTDSDNPGILNNLAYLLADQLHQPDEALKYAQRAQELVPENASIENTLGWVLYQKGLYSAAVPHLERAVAKEDTARRRYHLAMAYLKLGQERRGREILQAAFKMDPSLPEAKTAEELLGRSR